MKFQHFKNDLLSSFVVFFVAIPLSLGIGLASGTSLASGLIAAIVGGLVVGALSGAPLMVSGPAAGLTVMVFQIVQMHGVAGLAVATIVCGLMQIIFGTLKLGKIFQKIPQGILSGMLAAIGLIILLGQLHVLVGGSVPSSPAKAILTWPSVFFESLKSQQGWLIFGTGGLAIAILWFWPKVSGKFGMSWMPAALPAVVIATLAALPFEIPRVEVASLLNTMTESASQLGQLPFTLAILGAGVGLALVASAESLLTARATYLLEHEKLGDEAKRPALNRELFAQGVGNALSGLLGGLPVTGVIVRSAANISSGGRTRVSTIMHSVWIALFVLFFPSILRAVPLTTLAAVLVMTGVKLLGVQNLVKAWKDEKREAIMWSSTMAGIVLTDLLTGLAFGLSVWGVVALVEFLKKGANAIESQELQGERAETDKIQGQKTYELAKSN